MFRRWALPLSIFFGQGHHHHHHHHHWHYHQATSRYSDLLRGSSPGGDEIFTARADRPRGSSSFLYMCIGCFLGLKRSELGADHQPPSSVKVASVPPPPLCACTGLCGVTFTLTFIQSLSVSFEWLAFLLRVGEVSVWHLIPNTG